MKFKLALQTAKPAAAASNASVEGDLPGIPGRDLQEFPIFLVKLSRAGQI
jgi:hypothetical protein